MAELPADPAAPLRSPRHQAALDEFVRLWGEMATHWGINRTMAQIHALLYAAARPMDTDEIMDALDISRGNANTNLRLLVEWNLARKTNVAGSRKDFYAAETDVWTIARTVIEERRRREIQPVEQALTANAERLRADGPPPTPEEARFAARVEALVRFLAVFDGFTGALLPFLSEGNVAKVQRLVRFASRLRRRPAAAPADPSADA